MLTTLMDRTGGSEDEIGAKHATANAYIGK